MQIEIGDWVTKSQIEVADGPPIVHIPEDRGSAYTVLAVEAIGKSQSLFSTRYRRATAVGGSKTGTNLEIRRSHRGAERRLAGATAVRRRGCRTVDVGCTGAQAPARERQKGWSGAARRS